MAKEVAVERFGEVRSLADCWLRHVCRRQVITRERGTLRKIYVWINRQNKVGRSTRQWQWQTPSAQIAKGKAPLDGQVHPACVVISRKQSLAKERSRPRGGVPLRMHGARSEGQSSHEHGILSTMGVPRAWRSRNSQARNCKAALSAT
jgi:hypothetical protein